VSKAPRLIAAAVFGVAGVVALAWTAAGSEDPIPPLVPTEQHHTQLFRSAAEAARNRRVLLLHAEPGKQVTGRVAVSHQAAGGWNLFPAAPPSAPWLDTLLADLASAAASDWERSKAFSPDVVRACERLDVKLVLVDNGGGAVPIELAPSESRLAPRSGGVEVRGAQPIWQLLAERGTSHPSAAVRFTKGLRVDKALYTDVTYGFWSVEATIEALQDGDYLILLPADGARVSVNGLPVEPGRASQPFVVVPLTQGKHRVEVSLRPATLRDWIAIGGAVLLVVSFCWFILIVRPHPEPPEQDELPETQEI
jgi:hypothetical protein